MKSAALFQLLVGCCLALARSQAAHPLIIHPGIPGPANEDDSTGGILVADINGDARPDYLLTTSGHLAVCDNRGRVLWTKSTDLQVGGQSESQGLPGHHGPGVAAGDVLGDPAVEVVYLTQDGVLHIVDGATGNELASASPPVPEGAARWELAMIADFEGDGRDRDLLLQATNQKGYRTGRFLAAYRVEQLLKKGPPRWTTDNFVSCAHNGARLADLDQDGKDEVLGATVLGPNGRVLVRAADFRGHMDSVFVRDVRPDVPGLEVILLEEGSNQIQILSSAGLLWRNHHRSQEPQNAAVGRFQKGSDDMFVWCRSRYNEHQKPFVFDARGRMVFEYEMDKVAPEDWTASGVEVIHTIDWTGEPQQLACAKERHRTGDVCLFEPLTGKFVKTFPETAHRLYVADVSGDWREEIIVYNGKDLHVYSNDEVNPRPNEPRLWKDRNYRRLKQCHNYYSP